VHAGERREAEARGWVELERDDLTRNEGRAGGKKPKIREIIGELKRRYNCW
jgi:hypothetical protein